MPNAYFQFKQFIVNQDACAMKVCTDACILGAWFAEKIPSYSLILDAGCGTGLLMFMLAQKNKGEIHGIEIDLDAFRQSRQNALASKWKERVRIFPGDIRRFVFPHKYDFIISNPPFFENSLPSTVHQRNLAKHSKELTLSELVQSIDANLKPAGTFGVVLPAERATYFEELSSKFNFGLKEKLMVKQSPLLPYFRAILHFSRNRNEPSQQYELVISNEKGNYTEDFTELMEDYYLNLP